MGAQAKSLIDAVMQAQQRGDSDRPIDSFLSPPMDVQDPSSTVSGQVVLCLSPECGFKEDDIGQGLTACPICGFKIGRFYIEKDENAAEEDAPSYLVPSDLGHSKSHSLGHLRPGDKFLFTDTLPFKILQRSICYTFIPAPRGLIRFTDDQGRVYKLSVDYGFLYPVALLSGHLTASGRKFNRGDKVLHKITNQTGTVWTVDGDLCRVKMESNDTLVPVPSSLLDLTCKDETTRSYISSGENGGYIVRFAGFCSKEVSFLDALKILHREVRSGFYRLSKMMAADPTSWPLGDREINYLLNVDRSIWGKLKS